MEIPIHKHVIDKLAFLNSIVSGVALYPQVWIVFANQSVAGVSFLTFLVIFLNSVVWLLYAAHRGLLSLAIASFLNGLASGILLTAVWFF